MTDAKLTTKILHKTHKRKASAINMSADLSTPTQFKFHIMLLILRDFDLLIW